MVKSVEFIIDDTAIEGSVSSMSEIVRSYIDMSIRKLGGDPYTSEKEGYEVRFDGHITDRRAYRWVVSNKPRVLRDIRQLRDLGILDSPHMLLGTSEIEQEELWEEYEKLDMYGKVW